MRLKPIPLNEFHAHVKKMHENRDYGFEEEYQVSMCGTKLCQLIVFHIIVMDVYSV